MPAKINDTAIEELSWVPSRYIHPKLVGQGGQGEIWKAQCRVTGRTVALKKFFKGPGRFFYREFVNQLEVKCDHVVEMMEIYDQPDGSRMLVMEYCTGGNLGSYLEDGPRMTISDLLTVGSHISAALKVVHKQGIIHGDLKPENILRWRKHGAAIWKVGDFGIARHEVEDERIRCLTPAYAAPEQKVAKPTTKSDIYALGKILNECLREMVEDTDSDPGEELAETTLFDMIKAAIKQCLKFEEAHRPTAEQLHERLNQLLIMARTESYIDSGMQQSLRKACKTHLSQEGA